jgi:hypothetical protein
MKFDMYILIEKREDWRLKPLQQKHETGLRRLRVILSKAILVHEGGLCALVAAVSTARQNADHSRTLE